MVPKLVQTSCQRRVDTLKATGIVRRIDDLGRVVIPKEIRRTMRIREGDPLEIFVDRDGEVILKKYSPIGELGDFATEYADALHDAVPHIVLIADRDQIIAVTGASKKEFLNKQVSVAVEDVMESRRSSIFERTGEAKAIRQPLLADEDEGETNYTAAVVAPIVTAGDPIGAIILCSRDPNAAMGALELKLAETGAGFLARQMDQ
jgi:AbrB family transcriptional regulator (stage V sporulation protein T)